MAIHIKFSTHSKINMIRARRCNRDGLHLRHQVRHLHHRPYLHGPIDHRCHHRHHQHLLLHLRHCPDPYQHGLEYHHHHHPCHPHLEFHHCHHHDHLRREDHHHLYPLPWQTPRRDPMQAIISTTSFLLYCIYAEKSELVQLQQVNKRKNIMPSTKNLLLANIEGLNHDDGNFVEVTKSHQPHLRCRNLMKKLLFLFQCSHYLPV